MNEKHLLKILEEYVEYYNNCRTNLSLNKNSPMPREVEKPEQGKVTAIPKLAVCIIFTNELLSRKI
ncbi:MAG: IS3 family transposase [Planctomycetota bacterium]|jgi:hypothetical protein